MAKPIIKWAGGKKYLLPKIDKILVKCKDLPGSYIEPMVGGGSVFFHLRNKFKTHVIADKNVELVNLYKVVRDSVEDLIIELKSTKYYFHHKSEKASVDNFLAIRKSCPSAALEKAARTLFLLKTCFNGLMRVNKSGQFNTPVGSYIDPVICDEEVLRQASVAFQDVDIYCDDVLSMLKLANSDSFVFLDPPYHCDKFDKKFTQYSGEFSDNDQVKLIQTIANLDCKFIYTNRATKFILDELRKNKIKYATIPLKHSIQPKYTQELVDREVVAVRI